MTDYILEMINISKSFPGAKALDHVNLKIRKGEIHALVGENGSGKSTLMNILSGFYPYGSYEGEVFFENELCHFSSVRDSKEKGIATVYQELSLIPTLTISENIFLGNERRNRIGIDWGKTNNDALGYMNKVGLKESPRTLIKDIGKGKQQLVEIAKALSKDVKLLILDEPTSSLNEEESRKLLDLLLELKRSGITSILISHKLNEIAEVSDSITVLRDGNVIDTVSNNDHRIDEDEIISKMVGRKLSSRYPDLERNISDEVVLEVRNWNVYHPIYQDKKIINDVSFKVHKGEIVGFYGLQGSGRTELAMSIFGKAYGTKISGELYVNGNKCDFHSVKDAILSGLAYVSEDRMYNGLILDEKISFNTTLASLDKVEKHGIIDKDKETEVADEYRKKTRNKSISSLQSVRDLSGGNQQKVLLSKWLFTDSDILILDEPTRGIDVKAKYDIYLLVKELLLEGKTIIMISSELPEILGMCNRIYVMSEGEIIADLDAKDTDQEMILSAILRQNKKAGQEQ